MALAITLRYKDREYYNLISNGEELTYGSHKKDNVQIPDAKEHLMMLRGSSDEVQIGVELPLRTAKSVLECNQIAMLCREPVVSLYVSKATGKLSKSVELPYNGRITVGREKDNDIILTYPIISRHHFQFFVEAGSVHVEDLGSTHGLYLNGRRISKALMKSGDVLSIFTFRFILQNGTLYFENIGSSIHISSRIAQMDRPPGAEEVKMSNPEGKKVYQERQRVHLEGQRVHLEGQRVHPEGQRVAPEEQRVHLEGQRVHQEAQRVYQKAPGVQRVNPDPQKVRSDSGRASVNDALYPRYQLSPRIREQLPSEPIILSGAPGKGGSMGGRRNNLAYLISSGAMMAASLASGMLSPAALLMRAVGLISPLANMAMYNKMSKEEQKALEEYEKMRQERYQAYIDSQKARISKVADVQRRIITAENPKPADCMESVKKLKRNLWERMPTDSDFLTLRLGMGKDKLCVEVKSRANTDGFTMVDDELEELAGQIIEETRYVDNVPVRVSLLRNQTIGMVGSKEATYHELRSLLVELASEHSYKDVRIIGLFESESRKYWGVLRWLPHIWDESGQARFLAFDEKSRHVVCELIGDVIRQRNKEARSEMGKKGTPPLPHFVILAENEQILQEEMLYDQLISNNPAYGITTIILSQDLYNQPQTCQYIIDLTSKPYAYERERYDERVYFTRDETVHQVQLEAFSRQMAAIELKEKKSEASLPGSITFLEGFRVQVVEQLEVLKRWERSEPHQTLSTPLGIMAGGKTFCLNILDGDNAHGPHGLLAGTTGSGKSELLQTWILSMAVNYHPHDVNFVIIDYKGGGMSDLLEPLPHVVGKITNIDRNISRSLVSLESEMKRRESLFSQAGVKNISQYRKAYRKGEVKIRLPHLIIVTDEFAELKKEQPEFLTKLNSFATVGRSLGIHLFLATQKPAGVVTDQISANSRFRICMKVQDVADSREMLKRPDAARITQAGRAYVRVGEDELFELFQSYYSSAEYTGKAEHKGKKENQVRIVSVTGSRINPLPKKKKKDSEVDELTAIIGYINKVCKEQKIEKMAGPWLPELPTWLPLEELGLTDIFDGDKWPVRRNELVVPVGKSDMPQIQAQGVQVLDLSGQGHFGIFGTPATGKTFFLKTMLVSMGLLYTPKDVSITIFDAGSLSLPEFAGMPHVKEVITSQSEEGQIKKAAARLLGEIASRRVAFNKHAVNSLGAYRESVAPDTPAIVVLVDHIKGWFDISPEVMACLEEIAANGMTYGIYLVFTATSTLGLSMKFLQLIKGTIALRLADKGDYRSYVGAMDGISMPVTAGQAILAGNPPVAFQIAVYENAQNDQERHKRIVELTKKMADAWENIKKNGMAKEFPEDDGQGPKFGGFSGKTGLEFGNDYEKAGWKSESVRGQASPDMGVKGQYQENGGNSTYQAMENDRKGAARENGYEKADGGQGKMGDYSSKYNERSRIPAGIYADDLEPAYFDFSEEAILLLASEDQNTGSVFLNHLEQLLKQKNDNQILRIKKSESAGVEGANGGEPVTQLASLVENLQSRLKNRNSHKKEAGFDQEKWLQSYQQICVLIENLPELAKGFSPDENKQLRKVLAKSKELGIILIAGITKEQCEDPEKIDIVTKAAIEAENVAVLNGNPIEYHAFSCKEYLPQMDADLDEEEIAVVHKGKVRLIRWE